MLFIMGQDISICGGNRTKYHQKIDSTDYFGLKSNMVPINKNTIETDIFTNSEYYKKKKNRIKRKRRKKFI